MRVAGFARIGLGHWNVPSGVLVFANSFCRTEKGEGAGKREEGMEEGKEEGERRREELLNQKPETRTPKRARIAKA